MRISTYLATWILIMLIVILAMVTEQEILGAAMIIALSITVPKLEENRKSNDK